MKALAAECRSIDTRHGRVAYYVASPGLVHARYPGRTIDGIAVSLSSGYLARAAVEEPRRFRTICLVSATGLDRMKRFDGPPGSTRGKSWLLKGLGRARCAVPPADSSPGPPFLPREDLG